MKASPSTLLVAVTTIFVGVILLLGNMGLIPNNMMAIWPVVLIVAGLVGLTLLDGNPLKSTKSAGESSYSSVKSTKKKSSKKRK